jgi:predicted kinase
MDRRIVFVSGPPGAGKTTLALQLASLLGMSLVSKDTIKEAIWDALDLPAGSAEASARAGTAAMETLWALAAYGDGMILEANFRPHSEYERGRLISLDANVVEVYCRCNPEEAARRFVERAKLAKHHPAHVRTTVSTEFLAEFDGPMRIGPVIEVNTTQPVVDICALAEQIRHALDIEPSLLPGEQGIHAA